MNGYEEKVMLKKNVRGFTLIEMMLVVGIIALLTAIILPKFTNLTNKAQTEALNAQIKSINTQLQLYRIDQGAFPATMTNGAWTNLTTYWPDGIPSPNVTGKKWNYDSTAGIVTGVTNI